METVDEPVENLQERYSIVRTAALILISLGAVLGFYALFKVASVLAGLPFP